MTPAGFIVKWRSNTRNERAAAQQHFLDLPTPNSDPTGAAYFFEKGAAYGWPADLPDDEMLARLLALNHAR